MIDAIMISKIFKTDIGQIVETESSIDKIQVDQNMNYRGENIRGNARTCQNFKRQSSRGEYKNNYRNKSYSRNKDRNRSRERSFSRNPNNRGNDRSISNSRCRSGSKVSTN